MSKTSLPHALRARLLQDLVELEDSPYPGVAVFTDDADIRKLCLILTPPSGPWKDLSLHFDVVLPLDWPMQPPKIKTSVYGIEHPNLFGEYICCDLLTAHDHHERGYMGGYSPALTLRGLFLQFLTFFSSTSVEQDHGGDYRIGDYMTGQYLTEETFMTTVVKGSRRPPVTSSYRCNELEQQWLTSPFPETFISSFPLQGECPAYRQVREEHVDAEQVAANLIPPQACLLGILNDDVLLELELRCFFLRTSIHDSIIGVGVTLNAGPRTLSSDFDWLSQQAFNQCRVRTSIQKRGFQYFLPLALSPPHFERARKDIWIRLDVLDKAMREAKVNLDKRVVKRTGTTSTLKSLTPPHQSHQVVDVIYKMMNNIVVSLMKSCDDALAPVINGQSPPTILHASEKAVISYCHLFHLLLCLTRSTPAILRDATNRLRHFVMTPESRSKTDVPDLGELIVLMNFVLAYPPIDNAAPTTWQLLNGPFLQEAITRNVRWVLAGSPELEVLEAGGLNEYRLHKTFMGSRTSLRLMMFQVTFLDVFVKTYTGHVKLLDDNYGFPEPDIPEKMVKEVKEIYKVSTWPGFFKRVQYTNGLAFGAEKMSDLLRDAVRDSVRKGYHTPKSQKERTVLAQDRKLMEQNWIAERKA
ncbi:hypothetical protein DXG01_013044 [Tephrocybe rancida]|nr:hypothetical protein DXG01_013044 [Tephrocybe rancida]